MIRFSLIMIQAGAESSKRVESNLSLKMHHIGSLLHDEKLQLK